MKPSELAAKIKEAKRRHAEWKANGGIGNRFITPEEAALPFMDTALKVFKALRRK